MSKKIVLIEDTLEVRENIAEILELAGYEVATAENGKQGVHLVRTILPDLILCDIMMPELDGYGVIHVLSKDSKTATIPFIFLTAKADKLDVRKGMGLGADDYITKPFDEMDLLESIENRLKKIETIKATFLALSEGNLSDLNAGLSNLILNRKSKLLKRKETLYRAGDFTNFLFYLEKGKVKSSKTDEYGKELITQIQNKGEYLGYVDILNGGIYSETATILEDSTVLYIPTQEFKGLVFNDKDTAAHFIKLLSNNVVEKEDELLRLAFSPVRSRTARTLMRLFEQGKQSTSLINTLNREELASIIGTSTESLIRMLSDFKKEALISIEGKSMEILEPKMLQRIAEM